MEFRWTCLDSGVTVGKRKKRTSNDVKPLLGSRIRVGLKKISTSYDAKPASARCSCLVFHLRIVMIRSDCFYI